MQVLLTINNVEMMINAGVNVKNWLIKMYLIRDIFGILVIVSVNVIKNVGEYLDYKNCKCREELVDELVKECNEVVKEVKIVSENKNKCSSCILYIALFSIIFTINIGAYFVYYKYMDHNKGNISKYDYTYKAKKY